MDKDYDLTPEMLNSIYDTLIASTRETWLFDKDNPLMLKMRLSWISRSEDSTALIDWLKVRRIPIDQVCFDYIWFELTQESKTELMLVF